MWILDAIGCKVLIAIITSNNNYYFSAIFPVPMGFQTPCWALFTQHLLTHLNSSVFSVLRVLRTLTLRPAAWHARDLVKSRAKAGAHSEGAGRGQDQLHGRGGIWVDSWGMGIQGRRQCSPCCCVVTVAGSHAPELPHGGASNQRPLPTSFFCTLSSKPILRCFW